MVFSGVSFSKDLTIITFSSPGGGYDQIINSIKPDLETNGYTIDVKYYKTCMDAMTQLRRGEPNTLWISYSTDYNPNVENTRCVFNDSDNFVLYKPLIRAAGYVCFTPKNGKLSLNDLLGDKTYTIGVVADDNDPYVTKHLIKNSKLNLKIITYKFGSDLRAASATGDVDLILAMLTAPQLIAQGGKCVLSTMKNNKLNVPYMGEYMNVATPEFPVDYILWSLGKVDDGLFNLIDQIQHTPKYTDFLNKSFVTLPNTTPEQELKWMQQVNKIKASLRN